MKKLFAMVLVLVLGVALCACSGTHTNDVGETVEIERDINLPAADYIITKIDVSSTHAKGGYLEHYYLVTAENAEHVIVIDVTIEQYARWNVGDVITGALVGEYEVNAKFVHQYETDSRVNAEFVQEKASFDVWYYGTVN